MVGGKMKSWNIVWGYFMDLGRKWYGIDELSKGSWIVYVYNFW